MVWRSKRNQVEIIPIQLNCLVFFGDNTVLSCQVEPVIGPVIDSGVAIKHFHKLQQRPWPLVVLKHWDCSNRLNEKVFDVLYWLPVTLIKNTKFAFHGCCVKWKGEKVNAILGLHCMSSVREWFQWWLVFIGDNCYLWL